MVVEKPNIAGGVCKIPEELAKEFAGDLRIIGGHGGTGGIALSDKFLGNRELLRKLSQSFEVVLVPKEFIQSP